jgi:hypothetical protein
VVQSDAYRDAKLATTAQMLPDLLGPDARRFGQPGNTLEQAGSVRRSWPAHPRWLAQLRAEVRTWLAALGFLRDTAEDIVLAANEAAANAIDHAYPTESGH